MISNSDLQHKRTVHNNCDSPCFISIFIFNRLIVLTEYYCTASWNVEFKPLFAVLLIKWIEVGIMRYSVISKAETAEIFGIAVDNYAIRTFRNKEAIISK